jgi:hypothetical protein
MTEEQRKILAGCIEAWEGQLQQIAKQYIHKAVTKCELESLSQLATSEEQAFFIRSKGSSAASRVRALAYREAGHALGM